MMPARSCLTCGAPGGKKCRPISLHDATYKTSQGMSVVHAGRGRDDDSMYPQGSRVWNPERDGGVLQ